MDAPKHLLSIVLSFAHWLRLATSFTAWFASDKNCKRAFYRLVMIGKHYPARFGDVGVFCPTLSHFKRHVEQWDTWAKSPIKCFIYKVGVGQNGTKEDQKKRKAYLAAGFSLFKTSGALLLGRQF